MVRKLVFFGCLLVNLLFFNLNTAWSKLITYGSVGLLMSIISWKLSTLFMHNVLRSSLSTVPRNNKAVLVTGCDSGFGHLIALRLNEIGFRVFAGCLFPEGEGAKRLKHAAANSKEMFILEMDVTKDKDIDLAFNRVQDSLKDGKHLWAVVNNAGIARAGQLEWGSFDYMYKSIFDVNVFGVVKVTRKFLPLLREKGGRITNITSVAGRISAPYLGPYSMTKHAVVAFTEQLRRELRKFGIHVSTVEPYYYETDLPLSRDIVLKQVMATTAESVKQAYGLACFDKVAKSLTCMIVPHLRKYPEEVADAVADSIIAVHPSNTYSCSNFVMSIILPILSRLPSEPQDYLLRSLAKLSPALCKLFPSLLK